MARTESRQQIALTHDSDHAVLRVNDRRSGEPPLEEDPRSLEIRLPDTAASSLESCSAGSWSSACWPLSGSSGRSCENGPVPVVAPTLVAIVTWANTIRSLIPLLPQRFKIDPALVSAPLSTTLVDASGLATYLLVAKALLTA